MRNAFFGENREQLAVEAFIGAVLMVLVPLMMIVILYNFVIAAVFDAYAMLKDGYRVIIKDERRLLKDFKV